MTDYEKLRCAFGDAPGQHKRDDLRKRAGDILQAHRGSKYLHTVYEQDVDAMLALAAEVRAEERAQCVEIIRARADREYCLGIERGRRDDCRGEDYKLENNKFTKNELLAHREVAQHMGAHVVGHAIAEAIEKEPPA